MAESDVVKFNEKKRNGVISGVLRVRGAAGIQYSADYQPGIQFSLRGAAMDVLAIRTAAHDEALSGFSFKSWVAYLDNGKVH
jgi:hypothetical protein